MLATRMIALCDRDGCKARTKITVKLRMKPTAKSLNHPIVLQPDSMIMPDGWTWGFTDGETKIGCPDHPIRR